MLLGLSSGMFLGWSLGANDASNVFGTAVASHMIRFATAVKLSAVFVILGGLVNGPAAMDTLGGLGQIDLLAGAFATALAAAVAVAGMTWAGMPVSTSQAVVGALIGYRLFQHGSLDVASWRLLRIIVISWVACPILAAATAFLLYKLMAGVFRWLPMPLFVLDRWLRFGLLAVGCYGAGPLAETTWRTWLASIRGSTFSIPCAWGLGYFPNPGCLPCSAAWLLRLGWQLIPIASW